VRFGRTRCERRRRLFARTVWTAGVSPASPGAEGVGREFTTSRGVAGTLAATGPLAQGRQDACGPRTRCDRRRRLFARGVWASTSTSTSTSTKTRGASTSTRFAHTRCERRRRLFARSVWTAGVSPASPGAEGVGREFTTSRGVAGTPAAIGPLAQGRQDACGPRTRCGRRCRLFARGVWTGTSTSTSTRTRGRARTRGASTSVRFGRTRCERRRRLFARRMWTAGVSPAPPGAGGVGREFTTSRGVAGTPAAIGPLAQGRQDACGPRTRCERRCRLFARGVWTSTSTSTRTRGRARTRGRVRVRDRGRRPRCGRGPRLSARVGPRPAYARAGSRSIRASGTSTMKGPNGTTAPTRPQTTRFVESGTRDFASSSITA